MKKIFKKTKNKKSAKKLAETSVIKGTVIGLLVAATGSIVNGFVQYYYTKQQQETQFYLDEKKEFVSACNEYLTQYRNWHELMSYYSNKDSANTSYSEFNKNNALDAYHKWRNDIDKAYGKVYLLSDNEFGIKTVFMSQALTHSLQVFATTDSLSVNQRTAHFRELTIFFQQHWLFEARKQILAYNTGNRIQRSDEEFLKETGGQLNKILASDTSRVWLGDSTHISGKDLSELLFPE
jgi:hypothetical protein